MKTPIRPDLPALSKRRFLSGIRTRLPAMLVEMLGGYHGICVPVKLGRTSANLSLCAFTPGECFEMAGRIPLKLERCDCSLKDAASKFVTASIDALPPTFCHPRNDSSRAEDSTPHASGDTVVHRNGESAKFRISKPDELRSTRTLPVAWIIQPHMGDSTFFC
jgi:hypothetical protein